MIHARTDYDRIQDPAFAERPEVQALIDAVRRVCNAARPSAQSDFIDGVIRPLLEDYDAKKAAMLSTGSSPIGADEPVFLIRGKDAAAPAALFGWSRKSEENGGDPAICEHVRNWAMRMARWQDSHGAKNADAPAEVLRSAD